jgi:asparagine synthase (glutamine-hydrolysing)
MCGISGCVLKIGDRTPPTGLIAVVESQSSRGPDSTGYLSRSLGDGRSLWFAHNRLSIIDLSADANQPMVSQDGRYSLVFNGAIYNYVELREELAASGFDFRTVSDTEVLLAALIVWGEAGLARLYGMFTLAFHDRETNRLILARDRFGVKPLYYRQNGDDIWFASTAAAIARNERCDPDLEYVGRGIRLKYYEDETGIAPYLGIAAMPPGHYAAIDLSAHETLVPRPYYDLDAAWRAERPRLDSLPVGDLRTELFERLRHATMIRLRADVPIGISLSSGVDSTTVAALCAEAGVLPLGFCFGDPDDDASEAPGVRRFAAQLGQKVRFIPQKTGADAQRLFWRTLRAQGAPFPHTSQIAQYAVFEDARAHGIKVMLGGQGGDEAFMGYRKFFLFQVRHMLRTRDWAAAPSAASNILQILPAVASRAPLFWRERGRYSAEGTDGLGSGLTLPSLTASVSPGTGLGSDPAIRQALDVTRYSLPSLLRYEDRNSMGNSIESRLPFLDHRVIEFGIALPIAHKLRGGMGKYLLRDALRGKVPDWILFNRDKRGFDTRHADWIASGIGDAIRKGLCIHKEAAAAYLPADAAINSYFSDRELTAVASRFAEATTLLWLLDPRLSSYPES